MEKDITDLLARLDVLGAKLGVAGEVIWGAFIRQVHIQAVLCLFLLIVLVAAVYWVRKNFPNWKIKCDADLDNVKVTVTENIDENGDKKATSGNSIEYYVVYGTVVLIATILFYHFVVFAFNPEYYALQDLFRQIR
jgi:hypothetical protein